MAFGLSTIKKFISANTPARAKNSVVGVDIGTSSIKVVQLDRSDEAPKLTTYGELLLGPYDNMEVGRAVKPTLGRVTEALVDIMREASVTSKEAALAVPLTSSFVTVVTLPQSEPEQIAAIVPVEARKYIPVPIHEVTLDWSVLPQKANQLETTSQEAPAVKDEAGETDPTQDRAPVQPLAESQVLLAAIHNEAMDRGATIMRQAALTSHFSEIEVFSVIRSSIEPDDRLVAVMDMGASTTKVYIVYEGIIARTHSIAVGAESLTNLLASKLAISFDQAEELKRTVGLGAVGDVSLVEFLTEGLSRIMRETKILLEGYERENSDTIDKVIVTGGGSILRGFTEHAGEKLGRPVAVGNPFSKVAYPAFLEETLKTAGPSFSAAMGVALRLYNQ